jgi:hypothetical protein
MRTIPPQAKSVEQLIVDAFDDLADGGYPPPEPLGPVLFGVSLGRVNNLRSVAFEPTPMVLGTFETLIGYVGTKQQSEPTLPNLGFARALTAKKARLEAGRRWKQSRNRSQ